METQKACAVFVLESTIEDLLAANTYLSIICFSFGTAAGKRETTAPCAELRTTRKYSLDLLDSFHFVVPNVTTEQVAVLPVEAAAERIAEAHGADLRPAT